MCRYFTIVLFVSLAVGQNEYNVNHIAEKQGLFKKKFSDETVNGRVFKIYGDVKVYLGRIVNGKKESRWVTWKNDGLNKKYEEHYKNGKIHTLITWNTDGKKISNGQFWNDKPYNGSFILEKKVKKGFFSIKKPVLIKIENGTQIRMTWLDYNRRSGVYVLKDSVDCRINECVSEPLWSALFY